MLINVKPIPTTSDRINEIRMLTARIVNDEILPNENMLWGAQAGHRFTDADRAGSRRIREGIEEKVRQAGLWAPHLPEEYGGAGLSFLEHAYMNEVLAYASGGASLFGVVAPNSGNQSILVKYGTEEQKRKWLIPLIEGDYESGFSMTEPDQAGSGRFRPALSEDERSARRRRVGDQRSQVVHLQRHPGRLLHRDVPHRRCRCARIGQRQDDPDHRAEGHARRRRDPWDQRVGP